MKLNEGELATPTFGDKDEEINGEALEHWSAFIKALSGIEKSFQGEKDQNKDIYVTLLQGMDDEVNRRLDNVDAPSEEPDDEEIDDEEDNEDNEDKAKEPAKSPEDEAAEAEEADEVPAEESLKHKGDVLSEAERQTIRALELAGIAHPKTRIYKR